MLRTIIAALADLGESFALGGHRKGRNHQRGNNDQVLHLRIPPWGCVCSNYSTLSPRRRVASPPAFLGACLRDGEDSQTVNVQELSPRGCTWHARRLDISSRFPSPCRAHSHAYDNKFRLPATSSCPTHTDDRTTPHRFLPC